MKFKTLVATLLSAILAINCIIAYCLISEEKKQTELQEIQTVTLLSITAYAHQNEQKDWNEAEYGGTETSVGYMEYMRALEMLAKYQDKNERRK